jgi:hypothetical protein
MNDSIPAFSDRPFRERVELRTTFRKAAEIFQACSKFKEADKVMLLLEISRQVNELMPQTPTAGFAVRCLELAATAPNIKIRNALLSFAQISEAETDADD